MIYGSPHNYYFLFPSFQQNAADTYGIDPDGPAPSEEWDGPINDNVPFVEVPQTDFPLGDEAREIC